MWRTQYCQNDHTAKSSPQCDIQTIMLFTESENETHTQSDGKQRTRKPTQALQLAGTKVPRRVSPRGPGNTGYSVRRVTLSDLDNCTKNNSKWMEDLNATQKIQTMVLNAGQPSTGNKAEHLN